MAPSLDPLHEPLSFVSEPDAEQTIKSKGGVPDPRKSVVPVSLASDTLRKTAGRGSNDGARGLERQHLEE
jgi:hypothetical protein